MPVDMHPTQKKPTVEVILTVLHAGGKFDSETYAVSGGLHGVGVSVVNALSKRLEVEIDRDGFHWSQPYVDQKPAAPLPRASRRSKRGTTVTFWADDAIFETTTYNFETISRRLQEMAFLNKGLTIVLRDERAEKIVEEDDADVGRPRRRRKAEEGPRRRSPTTTQVGIADFVRHLNGSKDPIQKDPIYFEAEDQPTRGSRSRSPCSGTRPTPRACTRSPTRSTRSRAARTKRASGRR